MVYDSDHDTLRNAGTNKCATAVDEGKIKGLKCDNNAPGQKWTRRGGGDSPQLGNTKYRTCAEYAGLDAPLRLRGCNAAVDRQKWLLNEP
ncbi:ricin-type beta-trefoil lectin domain protein [Crossiella sp. CA198]|uniref:ricin-type beta-trefoil lectin domain protein n=1 Tax=Crossiella sp. CA198 TaxID=3455607 RepID=UPI003F8D78D3